MLFFSNRNRISRASVACDLTTRIAVNQTRPRPRSAAPPTRARRRILLALKTTTRQSSMKPTVTGPVGRSESLPGRSYAGWGGTYWVENSTSSKSREIETFLVRFGGRHWVLTLRSGVPPLPVAMVDSGQTDAHKRHCGTLGWLRLNLGKKKKNRGFWDIGVLLTLCCRYCSYFLFLLFSFSFLKEGCNDDVRPESNLPVCAEWGVNGVKIYNYIFKDVFF